jgi:lysozyme
MAKACGIPRGAYHLLSPKADADAQSDLFVSKWRDERGELPPVVDVELPPGCHGPCCELSCGEWTSFVARVLTRVESKGGVRPLVYAVDPFWKECLCNSSRFAERELWLAGYPRFDAAPRPGFGGFQKWVFYQAAGNAKLGRGVVDTDVFTGDQAAFSSWLLAHPSTETPKR